MATSPPFLSIHWISDWRYRRDSFVSIPSNHPLHSFLVPSSVYLINDTVFDPTSTLVDDAKP
jgi:hypothetical protein